jgi:hypothetical protein
MSNGTASTVWRATDEGDRLCGRILDIELLRDRFNPSVEVPKFEIEQEDGSVIVWYAQQTAARAQVARWAPQTGEVIEVTFLGTGQAQPGQSPPHRYKVKMPERPPEKIDYRRVSPDAEWHQDAGPATDMPPAEPEAAPQAQDDSDIPW